MMADYIMDVSKDVTRLAWKPLNNMEIDYAKDSENAIADQNSSGIEDQVIDVHSAEGTAYDEGDDELNKLKGKADSQRQPKNTFWFDARDKVNSKSERNGEQDILIDFPNAKFHTERIAITKIKRYKIYIWFEIAYAVFDGNGKNNDADNPDQVDAKHESEER